MTSTVSYLESNLAFIGARATRATADAVTRAGAPTDKLSISPAAAGMHHIDVTLFDSVCISLNTRRNPTEEAERQVANWARENNVDWSSLIVVVGITDLQHAKAICRCAAKDAAVLVVDDDPSRVKWLFERLDLADDAGYDCDLRFHVGEGHEGIAREYRRLLSTRGRFAFHIFLHPGLQRAYASRFTALRERLLTESRLDGMDRGTLAAFSDEWQQHTLVNLPVLLSNPGVSKLKDGFKGMPAIVVAAGPSLTDSLDILRDVDERAMIICVGTALKPLLKAGVRPHFVVAIDSDPKAWRQFDTVAADDVFLISASIVFPSIVNMFNDRLFSFSSNVLPEFNQWLAAFAAAQGELIAGGTVAVTAIHAAAYMGCSPVMMVGQDLAFLDDGTTHAKDSMYDGERFQNTSLVRVPGNYAETVGTSRQFSLYISIMESVLRDLNAVRGTIFLNANNAGARIANCDLIRPSQISEFLLPEASRFGEEIQQRHTYSTLPDPRDVRAIYERTETELQQLEAAAADAMSIVDRLLESRQRTAQTDNLYTRLDTLDKFMATQTMAMQLVAAAVKAVSMHIQSCRFDARGCDNAAGIQDALSESRSLYEHIAGASSWIMGMLGTSVERYEKLFSNALKEA